MMSLMTQAGHKNCFMDVKTMDDVFNDTSRTQKLFYGRQNDNTVKVYNLKGRYITTP